MANEIQISLSFQCRHGNFLEQFTPGNIAVDQNGIGRGGYTQNVGTTEEVISFGDVATNGYLLLRNLDSTNFVEYGPQSSGAMVAAGRLKPGEVALMRVAPGVVMRAKADTAAIMLDVRIFED